MDAVDRLRDDLNDGDDCRPPELRTNLLKLHGLAMSVVNEGAVSQAPEMFNLALRFGWAAPVPDGNGRQNEASGR